ncbi:hypothetical protein [Pseudoalteromonas pernae]|uniref:hypothetical protein n=1 Tax=Pseudoalteromonas pernae TaxID=3118054 RepID=UPI003242DF82
MNNKTVPFLLSAILTAFIYACYHIHQLNEQLIAMSSELKTQTLMVVNKQQQVRFVIDASDTTLTATALGADATPRFQLAMDEQENMNVFLFDIKGEPRSGYFSQQNGEFLKYEDNVAAFQPE